MNTSKINEILQDTAYIRTAGSEEELRCAGYISQKCSELGLETRSESFPLKLSKIHEARLLVDGKEIACKGYFRSGCADIEAELHYLTNTDPISIAGCKGKIVLLEAPLRGWTYRDILEAGACGFITFEGHVHFTDSDIDQKDLREHLQTENRIPGVHINVKDAVEIVRSKPAKARIILQQEEYQGQSQNIILDLPGEQDEWIVLTAHYDSTSLSKGAYDNMSGTIVMLSIAEEFAPLPRRRGLRFVWCGSEEIGLLGSKAYCASHEEDLKKTVLNINLDMIGCLMGKFVTRCIAEEKLVHYIQYLSAELGVSNEVVQNISSSDCAVLSDHGVPSVSFFRFAPPNTATFHNRYDTIEVMSAEQLEKDAAFVKAFLKRMVDSEFFPVAREIPANMKEKLEYYFFRKRDPALK